MRAFDPVDYPHGCRCACCREEFTSGDRIVDREVAPDWSTPTCEECAAVGAPLAADHPFRPGGTPVARADGFMVPLAGYTDDVHEAEGF